MKVAVQISSLGQRCGIFTYASRLNKYLNEKEDVESFMFANKPTEDFDVISMQYEPGLNHPQFMAEFINRNEEPIIVTAHHLRNLKNFYPALDGVVLHAEDQYQTEEDEPWDYEVIPHPALVFEKKDKDKLKEKFGLPKDKTIIGTAGFIAGTVKNLPVLLEEILPKLKDDEFLYFATSMWKGGDMGNKREILEKVKEYGKEDNFKIDTGFVDDETLNEKLQACDLLFAWNALSIPGSQSGIAADMYGSRTKLIVKDSQHYSFIGSQDKVLVGRPEPKDFIEDVLDAARNEDLTDTQNPDWLSWQNQVDKYIDYYNDFI